MKDLIKKAGILFNVLLVNLFRKLRSSRNKLVCLTRCMNWTHQASIRSAAQDGCVKGPEGLPGTVQTRYRVCDKGQLKEQAGFLVSMNQTLPKSRPTLSERGWYFS